MSSTLLKYDLRDEIENAAQRRAYENKAKGDGVGSTVAGAALGGLLGGPFGLLVREIFAVGYQATCPLFLSHKIFILCNSLVHKSEPR